MKNSIGFCMVLALGAGCVAETATPGISELGVKDFIISQSTSGLHAIAVDATGQQLGTIDFQVGHVKVFGAAHADDAVAAPEYWENGRRLVVDFQDDHFDWDSSNTTDDYLAENGHGMPFAGPRSTALLLTDPAIAPLLAQWKLSFPASAVPEAEAPAGERPYNSWHQACWNDGATTGCGVYYSLVEDMDNVWQNTQQTYYNYASTGTFTNSTYNPTTTYYENGLTGPTGTAKSCNSVEWAGSWGWYQMGGYSNIYSVLQSCYYSSATDNFGNPRLSPQSGWPYTFYRKACNTTGGWDGCGYSGPGYSSSCSACGQFGPGSNQGWVANYNGTSLGINY